MLVQQYHPGPHEAGIFYYRVPGEEPGNFSGLPVNDAARMYGDAWDVARHSVLEHQCAPYAVNAQVKVEIKRAGATGVKVFAIEGEGGLTAGFEEIRPVLRPSLGLAILATEFLWARRLLRGPFRYPAAQGSAATRAFIAATSSA